MNLLCRIAVAAALALPALPAQAMDDPIDDPIVGTWLTPKQDSKIEIAPCGDSLCGKIVWLAKPLRDDGSPRLDVNNDNEDLKQRPILGLEIVGGFEKVEPGKWEDGRIYNPRDGETYKSKMELKGPNTLEVKGCVLFICDGQEWTRVE